MNSNTPRTNARTFKILSSLQSGTEEVVHAEVARELEEENNQLRRWKKDAMTVMPDFQKIGQLLNLPFGSSVSEHIIPGIEKLLKIINRNHDKDCPIAWMHEATDPKCTCWVERELSQLRQ